MLSGMRCSHSPPLSSVPIRHSGASRNPPLLMSKGRIERTGVVALARTPDTRSSADGASRVKSYAVGATEVISIDSGGVEEACDVLAGAFADYPVMTFALCRQCTMERLRVLVRFFVMARIFRKEAVVGLMMRDVLAGVALVSFPSGVRPAGGLDVVREDVWRQLGEMVRGRDTSRSGWPSSDQAIATCQNGKPRSLSRLAVLL